MITFEGWLKCSKDIFEVTDTFDVSRDRPNSRAGWKCLGEEYFNLASALNQTDAIMMAAAAAAGHGTFVPLLNVPSLG